MLSLVAFENQRNKKIVVYTRGRQPQYVFTYMLNGLPVEIYKEFYYKGVIFSRPGLFLTENKRYKSRHKNVYKEFYGRQEIIFAH